MRRLNQVTPTLGRPKFQGTCSITSQLHHFKPLHNPFCHWCLTVCFFVFQSPTRKTWTSLQKEDFKNDFIISNFPNGSCASCTGGKITIHLICCGNDSTHVSDLHQQGLTATEAPLGPLICCRWLPLIRVVSLIAHARINFCWCPSWDLHYFHLFLAFQLLSPPQSRRTWMHGTQSLPATSTTRIFHKHPMWRFSVLWSPVSMKKVQVDQHLKRGRLLLMTT